MNTSSRLCRKLSQKKQSSNYKKNFYKLINQLFAVSCLITLIAAFTIISPAQSNVSASATSSPNTIATFVNFEGYNIFSWIYESIFPDPEKTSDLLSNNGGEAETDNLGRTATVLENGDVLIVGGNSAEIYFTSAADFGATGTPITPRKNHAAIRLSDGRVLISGGNNGKETLRSTEIFDPSTGIFTAAADMNEPRAGHTATALSDGRILIAGKGTAEIYNPADNSFAPVSNMNTSRANHSSVLMRDGQIVIIGGTNENGEKLATAEVFNPLTNEFSNVGAILTQARQNPVLNILQDGKIQIIGGSNEASMEIFDPAEGKFGAFAQLPKDGSQQPELYEQMMNATTRAAVIGGKNIVEIKQIQKALAFGENAAQTATLYQSSTATITTNVLIYEPGSNIEVSGAGFQPNETVELIFYHSPKSDEKLPRFVVQANENGAFEFNGFAPKGSGSFIIAAKGEISGFAAQTTVSNASANITQIGFNPANPTTFTVGISNVTSSPLRVRTQNSSGNAEIVTDGGQSVTIEISSSSPTGRFDTQSTGLFSGSTISLSVNTGSSNTPNFYYRDTSAGSHTLTATVTAVTSSVTSLPVNSTATQAATVSKANSTTTIALVAGTNPSVFGNSVSFKATAAHATGGAGTPGGTVEFKDGASTIGTETLNGSGEAIFTTNTLSAGSHTISASYAGDGNFNGSNSSTLTQEVNKADQNIVFEPLANKTYGDSAFNVIATGGDSGNPITFSTLSTSCTVTSGGSVTLTGAGSCTITASQVGNSNYNDAPDISQTFSIAKKALTATATGDNKVYDSGTSATVTLSFAGVVSPDVVTATYTAAFDNKNVGTGKDVSVSLITLDPTSDANYTVNPTTMTTADITAKTLTVSATGQNKVYDGNDSATVTLSDDRISGDDLTTNYGSAMFDDKNVGTGKMVSVSGISISGTDSGNYTANTTATTTADITPKTLTITASAVSKIYDGNTIASVTLSDDRISGDVFTTAFTSATFDDENAGTGKTVTVSGITITGTDAGNYSANTDATATADITPRDLNVTATGINKIYDATTNATVNLSDDRISGDDLTANYTSASFADKDVGAGKTISVSGISISGMDAGNYSLANTTATTTADITAKTLTVSATGQNKVYDGNDSATVTLSDDRISGDDLTTNYGSAMFDDKNVGTGKMVSVSGISISGTDSGNYTANTTASTTADITALMLTASFTTNNKTYDGTAAAMFSLISLSGVISPDDVSLSGGSATFDTKDVGMGKTVTISGYSLAGADAGNYTVNPSATATADITALMLTANVVVNNKVYDGTTAATIASSSLSGVIGSDDVSLSGGTAMLDTKDVGMSKSVTITGLSLAGADAGNYTVSPTATSSADITALMLTASFTVNSKTYDGTTSATIASNSLTGVISPDDVSLSGGTATFDDDNVGTGINVTISGYILAGADAGNYTVNPTASTTADITALMLTASFTANSKTYDGTAAAMFSLISLSGVISPDDVSLSGGSATFDTKDVGMGKTVTISGYSLAGADAGNYTVNPTATTTADITVRTLVVLATGQNKEYDGNDSATVTLSDNHVLGDDVTTAYTTATFDDANVGTGKPVSVSGISITGGADAGNYTLNGVTTASTTADITARAITVTADPQTKVYGDPDPALTYQITNGSPVSPDTFTGSLSRAAGETVAVSQYAIQQGTLALNSNYNLTFVGDNLTITQKPASVTPDAASKTFGDVDPAFTGTLNGFLPADNVTATYSRDAGETVGTYTISAVLDPVGVLDNYNITYNTAVFTINPQPTVSIGNASPDPVTEGGSANFTVSIDNPSSAAITVNVTVTGGAAPAADPADISSFTTSVTFPANDTTDKTVTVNTFDDSIYEGATPENYSVNITASNATIGGTGSGTGAIAENDMCNFVVTPTMPNPANFGFASGSGTFDVTVTSGCTWTISDNAGWITSSGSGSGSQTGLTYTVDSNAATMSNSGAARTGMIAVNGDNNGGSASFTVNQAAAPVDIVIPTGLTGLNGSTLVVPVNISETMGRGIVSYEFDLTFDDSVLTFTGVDISGTVSSNWTGSVFGNATGNTLSVSGAGPALSGNGTLVNLIFTINGLAPNCSDFDFVPNTFLFNGGTPAAATTDGQACVIPSTISGTVTYANAIGSPAPPRYVDNVTLTATGGPVVTDITDALGLYDLSISASGSYTVVPSRDNYPRLGTAITADDATLIQRARVGLVPALVGIQKRAADVNKDGLANSFDASLIQQFKVGIANPGVNFTGTWEFNDSQTTYPNANQSNQTTDYTAVLLGDANGNWESSLGLVGDGTIGKNAESNNIAGLAGVSLTLPTFSTGTGTNFDVPVNTGDLTGLNASSFDFDLLYDPAVVVPQGTAASNTGTLSGNCSVFANVVSPGRLAVSTSCLNPMAGTGTLINLKFTAIGANGTDTNLSFDPFVFNSGNPQSMPTAGNIQILAPSSASVSVGGKLLTSTGRGVPNARVILISTTGERRSATSNSFGYYRFEGVAVGQTYTVSVNSRGYNFAPRVISVVENVTDFDLIAEP